MLIGSIEQLVYISKKIEHHVRTIRWLTSKYHPNRNPQSISEQLKVNAMFIKHYAKMLL